MRTPIRWWKRNRVRIKCVVLSILVWGGAATLMLRFALMPAQSETTLDLPDTAAINFLRDQNEALLVWGNSSSGGRIHVILNLRTGSTRSIDTGLTEEIVPSVDGSHLVARRQLDVAVFDSRTGQERDRFVAKNPGSQVVLARDGKTLLAFSPDSATTSVRMRDLDNPVSPVATPEFRAVIGAIAPDGGSCVAKRPAVNNVDNWVVYRLPDFNHGDPLRDVVGARQWTYSPDGQLIATEVDGSVRAWGLDDSAPRIVEAAPQKNITAQLRFSPHSHYLAIIWGTGVFSKLVVVNRQGVRKTARDGVINLAFSADGNRIAYLVWDGPTKKDKALMLFDMTTGQERRLRTYETSDVEPAVNFACTIFDDKILPIYYARAGGTPVGATSKSPYGSSSGSTDYRTNEIQFVDLDSGKMVAWLPGGANLAVSPDGRHLLWLSKTQPWFRWFQKDSPTGPSVMRGYDLSSRPRMAVLSQWPIVLTATLVTFLFVWRPYFRRRRELQDDVVRNDERFERVKKSGNPELVRHFLRKNQELNPQQICDLLLIDQSNRWQTGEPVLVGDYLRTWPAIAGRPDLVLEILVADGRLARNAGRKTEHDELLNRYPDLRQEYHNRLLSDGSTVDAAVAPQESIAHPPLVGRAVAPLVLERAHALATSDQASPVTVAYLPPTETYSKPVPQADPNMTGSLPPQVRVAEEAPPQVKRIGRYQIEGVLGQGAFATVYLALDDDLKRQVAVKVPKQSRIATPEDVQAYIAEARVVAGLDHPAIVPVYDVGHTDDGLCFVVSKYIPGSDLSKRIERGPLPVAESVAICTRVADALQHAHEQGLVHRDVKPANLLLDAKGNCFVADFGLAMRGPDHEGRIAGTPAYMSPEQTRGDNRRLDGRSDLFGLGAVFYEMLTGRRPFYGPTTAALFDEITKATPRMAHQLSPRVPLELSRVCARCLAKSADERYASARDLAHALRRWSKDNIQARVDDNSPRLTADTTLPERGRPFEASASHQFVDLLLSARPQDGGLFTLRTWKEKLEGVEFRAGIVVGPAGSGKSSFLRAGLLPRLGRSVVPIVLDAGETDVLLRMRGEIVKAIPEMPEQASLVEAAALLSPRIPSDQQPGLLVIFDQFERWLSANGDGAGTALGNLLRRCAGPGCKFLFAVRDESFPLAQAFFGAHGLIASPGENVQRLDTLDADASRRVLARLGFFLGRLPDAAGELSVDQWMFINRAVSDMSDDGKIRPIRIAQLAGVFRDQTWAPTSYSQRGGFEGSVSVNLADRFPTLLNDPHSRCLHEMARRILSTLAPQENQPAAENGVGLKELRKDLGEADEEDFDDVMRILDADLRVVIGRPTLVNAELVYAIADQSIVSGIKLWLGQKSPQRQTSSSTSSMFGDIRVVTFFRSLIFPGKHVTWYERVAAWLTALCMLVLAIWLPWIVVNSVFWQRAYQPPGLLEEKEWWEPVLPALAALGSVILFVLARTVATWRKSRLRE